MSSNESLSEFIKTVGVIGEMETLLYKTFIAHGVPSDAAMDMTVDTITRMIVLLRRDKNEQ